MKQKICGLVTIALICLFTFSAFKHNSINFQVVSCGLNSATGVTGEVLEQATGTLQKGKGKSTGSTYSIEGTRSLTNRFKIGDQCFQVVRSTGQPDPATYVSLYKLTVGKTNRSFAINNDGSASSGLISVQLIQDATTSSYYKVFLGPGASLFPGEYAFIDKSTLTTDGKINVWAFGID